MAQTLCVRLGGRLAGTVERLRGGTLRFDYLDEYRQLDDAVPLSLSMPLEVRTHPDSVITPWLWGLLPDNEAVLGRWARDFHVSAKSPFSLLSSPIGEDCAGAVQFVGPDDLDRVQDDVGTVSWLSDDDVEQRLRELKEDSTAWLGRSFTGQFSLAGAQSKTALLWREGRWGVPSGATPTTHILKPAVTGFDDHDLNEHLCLDAARRVGMLVARTSIERFGDETAVVIERYDRFERDGKLVRIHQEDLCQALGISPDRKYQNEGGPSATDIVRLLRSAMPAQAAEEAVWRFVEALIWNWIVAGTDAHAKNYSVLLAARQVRLAPLYDIASALPYPTHEKRLKFAMKLGGHYDVFTYRNPWPRTAADIGLDEEDLLQRVRRMIAEAPDAFSDAAADPQVRALDREIAPRLVDRVRERVERCNALVGSDSDVAA